MLQYYDATNGQFFLHHPFEADVSSNLIHTNSFAEIYWEDKIMPFVGGTQEAAKISPGEASSCRAKKPSAVR